MADSLAGRTVLIARDPSRAEGLRARLEALGAAVIVSPVTATMAGDEDELDAVTAALPSFDWVVVASVNAVNALRDAAQRASVDLTEVPTSWAAVGPTTASALDALGITVAIVPEDHSAAGLVAELAKTATPGQRALLPQGDLAAPTMAEGLQAAGFGVTAVTAYRTVPEMLDPGTTEAWAAGTIDAAVIAASSAARQVAAQVDVKIPVAIVAIGNSTAKTARECGFMSVVVADDSTDDALADAVYKAAADNLLQ
ncbi:MAG: uroporphyrinogen-III synthase [Propionibacteriaceae bacterium]|nr:uroporphyrinogen-III synthase [Propionibacteriaceae bacterium]